MRLAKKLGIALTVVALIAAVLLIAPVGGLIKTGKKISFQPGGDGATPVWLIAGPFQDTGDNALFADCLWWVGGEGGAKARDGGIAGRRWHSLVRWQQVTPAEGGVIDFAKMWPLRYHSVAYAYTEIESDSDTDIVATIGSGTYIQVWLNGRVIFEDRLLRHFNADRDALVLPLRKGTNTVLVKALEMAEELWRMQWQTRIPSGRLFVNQTRTIVPDFVVGETQGAWGQVEVANASREPATGVVAEVVGDEMIQPSQSDPVRIEPGEMQRIPVWIASRGPAPEKAPGPIRLRVSSGSEACSAEFTPRIRNKDQYFGTTFRSAIDGSVQPYSVWLPSNFNPKTTYPLIVLLHGGTVTDWWQNIFAYSQKSWAILAAPGGRGDNSFRDIGEKDLDEMISVVADRYHIDRDRLYLSGHSDGGYGVWYQATRRPYLWSSVSAQAAATDAYFQRPDLQKSPGVPRQPFQRQLLDGWSPIIFAENMMYVPAYVIHGDQDGEIPPKQSRQMSDRLSQLGYTCILDEYPNRKHWWWGPPSKAYHAECVDKPAIYEFLQRHSPRVQSPARVVYETDSLHYNRAYWLTIDEMDDVNSRARIEANISERHNIELKLTNIAAITLDLTSALIDGDKPLTVVINGAVANVGAVTVPGAVTFARGTDGVYRVTPKVGRDSGLLSGGVLKKTHDLYGPIPDAFTTPFLFVRGTQGQGRWARALSSASNEAARVLARDWMMRANGIVAIKDDIDVSDADIARYSLILFGNAETNSVIARINSDLPIRFSGSGIALGEREFAGGEIGMVESLPNPLNHARYVVVVGSSSPRAFQIASRLRFADLPDYVLFDRDTLSGKKTVYVAGGFFNKYWQLDHE